MSADSKGQRVDSDAGALTVLEIADDADAWAAAGFAVAEDRMVLDGVVFRFVGSGSADEAPESDRRGIRRWHLTDIAVDGSDLDGLAGVAAPRVSGPAESEHPNGIDRIDHLVIATPNIERTIEAFERSGLAARRTRTFNLGSSERQQTFFWAGSTILEMIGVVGDQGEGPATFWGLALVSPDLDATAAFLGDRCTPPKDAVQRGRRIATVETELFDISVPLAVMTPHARRDQPE